MRVIGDLSTANARRHPDKVALVQGARAYTYLELERRANRFAHALARQGLLPGDRLGLLACNHLDYAVITQGAAKAGVLLVPLNFRLTAGELATVLADARVELLVTEAVLAPLWQGALQRLGRVAPAVVLLPAVPGEAAVPLPAAGAAHEFEEWMADAPESPVATVVDPATPCAIMYTSGTTGAPKGVLVPHSAYFRMYLGTALETGLSRDDRYLMAVPMFHAAGLNLMLHQCLFMGASGFIHRGTLEPERLFALIASERLTMAVLVPPVIGALARHPARARHDLSSLRTVYYGSMPMPPGVLAAAREAFPETAFHQIYGSTESGLLGVLPWRDHGTHAHCTGREALFSHLRIIDAAGREVAEGEVGEVVGAASGGMLGYWRNPAATAAKLREGWIHTGDLARREGDGYFTLVGRLEEVIASGGEKVHPGEVEQVLANHPAVSETAVFGAPDDTFGEAVCAAVVVHAGGSVEASALDAYCRQTLAAFKCPRRYLFVDSLPRNASDKVQRGVLRERLLAGAKGTTP